MPDLGDISKGLGLALLSGAGPSGRAAASGMINQDRALAYKRQEAEAERVAQQQQAEAQAGKQTFGLLVEGLKQSKDPAQQKEILGAIDRVVKMNPNLASPEALSGIEALAGTGVTGKNPTKASLALDAAGGDPNKALELLSSGDSETERVRKIRALVDRGIDENTAADLVEGRVRLTSPDQFGNIYSVNITTGKKKPVVRGQAATPAEQTAEAQPEQQGPSIASAARKGTGPVSYAQDVISNLFGFAVEGQVYPENAKARQRLNFFNKTAQESLIQNPKFPVTEQKFVRGLLPSTEQIFKDPDDAVSNLVELGNHLEAKIAANEKSISSGMITEKRKGELANQNDSMKRVMSLMGDPEASQELSMELARKVANGTATDEELDQYLELKGQ